MTALEVVFSILLGLGAGVFSGLLGVGGGIIIVPGLVLILSMSQHVAQGTSLLIIIPSAAAGALTAIRRGLVDWRTTAFLAAGGVLGAIGGALLATQIITDERVLRRIFAVFLFAMAARLLLRRRTPPPGVPEED